MQSSKKNCRPKAKLLENQEGQSIVEFMLLFVSILVISFIFLRTVNSNISEYWIALANLILDDSTQTLRLR